MIKKLLFLILILTWISQMSCISRGTERGSIYISNTQYIDIENYVYYNSLFYSPDHGETIIRRFTSNQDILKADLSDAAPGTIYLYNRDYFEVSYDMGADWEFVEEPGDNARYGSGTIPGEIYKWDTGIVYRSVNYGCDYVPLYEILSFVMLDVGSEEGEIYTLSAEPVWPPTGIYLIGYSNDYGASFTFTEIDTTIAGTPPFGTHRIYRGSISGELYLVTRGLPNHYSIYYSTDYGQSFELKYQGEDYDPGDQGYSFSPGNEPGSFYMIQHNCIITPNQTNFQMIIYHSTDYGETFTEEYYHYLDDTFENPSYLVTYPSELNVESATGEIVFDIASNENWTIEYNADWIINVSPLQGSDDEEITINYATNLDNTARTAEIIIHNDNIEDQTVYLIQEGSTSFLSDSEILIPQISLTNYPNPFNPSTTFSFYLLEDSEVDISIYNIKGQIIKKLCDNKMTKGDHKLNWSGIDDNDNPVDSGLYIYKLVVNGKAVCTKKCLLLK